MWFGICWLVVGAACLPAVVVLAAHKELLTIGVGLVSMSLLLAAAHFFRMALRVPEHCLARFNRRQRKVYINHATSNRNPFGVWRRETKVVEWERAHAEIIRYEFLDEMDKHVRHYSLELIDRDPQAVAENERVRLRANEESTQCLVEQWEYLRSYMNEGPASLPFQPLPPPRTAADELFVCVPWLAPSEKGRTIRARMGIGLWSVALPLSLMLPLCLIIGAVNLLAMWIVPVSGWPDGMDEASRR